MPGFRENNLQIMSFVTNLRSSFAEDLFLRSCPLLPFHAPNYFMMPCCFVNDLPK